MHSRRLHWTVLACDSSVPMRWIGALECHACFREGVASKERQRVGCGLRVHVVGADRRRERSGHLRDRLGLDGIQPDDQRSVPKRDGQTRDPDEDHTRLSRNCSHKQVLLGSTGFYKVSTRFDRS